MRKLFNGLVSVFSMFTVIPMPQVAWSDENIRYMLILLPFVGLAIGGLWYITAAFLLGLPISYILKAFFCMIIPFLLTGFLHADGFSDTCDAVFSGREKGEKIKILKDPHIGVFGACALITMFLLNFSSSYALAETGKVSVLLIGIPVVSRCMAAICLIQFKPLEGSNLGTLFKKHCRKGDRIVLGIALMAMFAFSLAYEGIFGLLVLLIGALSGLICGNLAYKNLGGFSGDVSGFLIVICESISFFLLACGVGEVN